MEEILLNPWRQSTQLRQLGVASVSWREHCVAGITRLEWDRIKNSDRPQNFYAFLKKYPDGKYHSRPIDGFSLSAAVGSASARGRWPLAVVIAARIQPCRASFQPLSHWSPSRAARLLRSSRRRKGRRPWASRLMRQRTRSESCSAGRLTRPSRTSSISIGCFQFAPYRAALQCWTLPNGEPIDPIVPLEDRRLTIDQLMDEYRVTGRSSRYIMAGLFLSGTPMTGRRKTAGSPRRPPSRSPRR